MTKKTRTNPNRPSERDIAEPIGTFLRSKDFALYPEVEFEKDRPVADWVALHANGQRAGVIECKTTLSVKLLRQACWWLDKADWVTVGLPAPKGKHQAEERVKCHDLLQRLGLGLLEVADDGAVNVVMSPNVQEPGRSDRLIAILTPGHQAMGKAGTSKSDKWTPYQQTVANLRRFVADNPGCTLKEALRSIDHHYATLQQAITKLANYATNESGLRGIRTERVQGLMRLYLIEDDAA